MVKVTYELNGRKIDPNNFASAIEEAIFPAVAQQAREIVMSHLTAEEQDQITIQVEGRALDDLSFTIKGPQEIVEKLKKELK